MKGKVNIKTIVILVVLLAVIILGVIAVRTVQTFMSGATSDVEPTGVTVVSSDDGKTATISWVSDKAAISKVEYGTTAASLVLLTAETDSVTNHKVSLSSLRANTTYYFRIRVGDDVFDNSGIPYTFRTKGESSATAPTTVPSSASGSSIMAGSECKSGVDYNSDGVINSIDIAYCRQQGGTVVSSPTVKPTAVPTVNNSKCSGTITDYNSDGVVNSLDRINCLQSIE